MQRVLVSSTGWLLVLAGVVLYPLPGPGLLLLALGVGLLGRYDPWAARRLEPLRHRAVAETRRTVATWPRTLVTAALTAAIGVSGLVWLYDPAQPEWWGLPAWTWFPGGVWAGVGQIVSGAIGLGIVVWARVALVEAPGSERVMNTLSGSGR
jgi:hypothetical protein